MNVEYSFIQVSSYSGVSSTGRVRVKSWIDEPIEGRHVIVVEDILDTGLTLSYVIDYLKRYRPADLKIVTMLKKLEGHHQLHQISLDLKLKISLLSVMDWTTMKNTEIYLT